METINNWFSLYFITWVIALVLFTWISFWFMTPAGIRYRDALGISLQQFVMHVKLTPAEVKRRLIGAVEPFTLFRNPFTLNVEAYAGQWLTDDRFELHRLIPRNAWHVYGEIFPYLQDTTLIRITLKTPSWGLAPLVMFLLNPITLGILARAIPTGRAINPIDLVVFIPMALIFCFPGSFIVVAGLAVYAFTLSRESGKVRAFLERVFAL